MKPNNAQPINKTRYNKYEQQKNRTKYPVSSGDLAFYGLPGPSKDLKSV